MSCKDDNKISLPRIRRGGFFYANKSAGIANKKFISKPTYMSFPLVRTQVASFSSANPPECGGDSPRRADSPRRIGNHSYEKDCGQAAMTEIKTEWHSTYDSISNFVCNLIDISTFSELAYA